MPLTRTLGFLFLILLLGPIIARAEKGYQHGTINPDPSSPQKFLVVAGSDKQYRIKNCGEFQAGQAVDYRVEESNLYIRRDNGKEQKCSINSVSVPSTPAQVITYQKGTITGWSTRIDSNVAGGGNNSAVWTHKRRTRIYELKANNLIYEIDDCGSFQAGQFTPGQVVDFRVDESNKRDRRLYIRREDAQEYKCRMEGVRAVDGATPSAANSTPH